MWFYYYYFISIFRNNIIIQIVDNYFFLLFCVEIIQNIESIKDQLVVSRAELMDTANELSTINDDELAILHYVSTPSVPNKASGLGFVLTTLACTFVAFFFSVLLFSFTAYIKALANTNR